MDKPVGYAPFHPVLGWDFKKASHDKDDVEAFMEHASALWEVRPLYAAPHERKAD